MSAAATTKKKAGHLLEQVPAVVPTDEGVNMNTVPQATQDALERLGVRVVEVDGLKDSVCWVRSQQILLLSTGVSEGQRLEALEWGIERASVDRLPYPVDIALPDWATGVTPVPDNNPGGWEWRASDRTWTRAPRFMTDGDGWEIYVEGAQRVLETGIVEENTDYFVDIETTCDQWTPEGLRQLAKGVAAAADLLHSLQASEIGAKP